MDDSPSLAEQVLVKWFELSDRGEEADVEELCGSADPGLIAEVHRLLGHQRLVDMTLGSDEPRDPVGPRIPGLDIIALLGRGGMGEVWLARDLTLSRLVAVKVFARAGQDARELLRIRREAEVAASLEHPNIVPVFGFGETEGLAWISMRWLEGPSLDQVASPLEVMDVARIGAAVAKALHAAHEAGIIHRDVKPANVILDSGRPYVVDFGLARSIHHPSLTASNATPGTLLYMPPERLVPGSSLPDPRGDVYGLGATLYQVLTGRPPFEPTSPSEIVRAILEVDPPAMRLKGRGRDLEAIVFRALEKNPADRYQTAADLAKDLERLLEGRSVSARRFGWVRRTGRRLGRHPRTVVAVGILALAAGVSSAAWWASTSTTAARRETVLDAVRTAIAAGHLSDAEARLESLDREHPQVRRHLATLEGCWALEDLLDAVLARPEDQSPSLLYQLLARVDATSPAGRSARGTELAAAVALFMLGDAEGARARLDAADAAQNAEDALGRPATVALRALIDNDTSVILAPEPPSDLLELAFAAQGLRLLQVGEATLRDYIAAAGARRDNPRAQFLAAIDFIDRGELSVAREKLEDLAMVGRRSIGADTLLAWIAVLEGDRNEAKELLESIGARVTPHPPPRAVVLGAMLDIDAGDRSGARTRLEEALLHWPEDPLILYNLALLETDPQVRMSRLTSVWSNNHDVVGAALARSVIFRERHNSLLVQTESVDHVPPDRRGDARSLMVDIDGFVATCRHAYARSTALVVRASLANFLRDEGAALASIVRALDAESRNPFAITMAAELSRGLASSGDATTRELARATLERVRPSLERLAEGLRLGPWTASPVERKAARHVLSDW